MSHEIIVQFVGFESKPLVREYTFTVREPSTDPREFTFTIPNQAFNERRVRYQDAPDVCSLKLRHELAANANHPPNTHFRVSDEELEDYRSAHAPRTTRSPFGRKAREEY
ncbi:MAG TPA: hypothetical protein VEI55_02135 [Candidatus Acidoferrum sp.]|nr:hypothetical protein [Candidatus Acidoferrum sp.]